MTHFHGTGSPSLSCHSSAPQSACHNHHSLPPPHPPSHNSLFRHSASISTFPCPGALSLSRSLSDPRCHKPSYILPRVTKLRDAGDKGSSSPGTGTRRITSLAVCLSLIFTPVGSQTVTPQPAMRAVMVFFFFFPTSSQTQSAWQPVFQDAAPTPPSDSLPEDARRRPSIFINASTTTNRDGGGGRKKRPRALHTNAFDAVHFP